MIDLVYLRQRAVVHSRMRKAPSMVVVNPTAGGLPAKNEQAWRKYGQAKRRELVEQDDLQGGKEFDMNPNCKIECYFQLAERVVAQFKTMIETLEPLTFERTYIMGHRLVAFFSEALPRHPEYMDSSMDKRRSETIRDLVWIHQRLEEIALKIDEEQLNRYITDEYEPEADDDSTTCSSSSSGEETWSHGKDAATAETVVSSHLVTPGGTWESFDGWSLDTSSEDETPHLLESDTSLTSSRDTISLEDLPEFDNALSLPVRQPVDAPTEELNDSTESEALDPDLDMDLLEEDEDDAIDEKYMSTLRPDLFEIQQAVRSSQFLRQIAEEDVEYEWDSEANDSWAQDVDSDEFADCVLDLVDSFDGDDSRMALGEIVRNVGGHFVKHNSTIPHLLAKSLTFDEDMPDDEATWSAKSRPISHSLPSTQLFSYEVDAPDDEARSWASVKRDPARRALFQCDDVSYSV